MFIMGFWTTSVVKKLFVCFMKLPGPSFPRSEKIFGSFEDPLLFLIIV